MERVVSATEARVHFGEVLRRVAEGDTVVVERGGKPQAVMLAVDQYERLRDGQAVRSNWRDLLEEAWDQIRRDGSGPLVPPPEEVIREMREERDVQLLDLR